VGTRLLGPCLGPRLAGIVRRPIMDDGRPGCSAHWNVPELQGGSGLQEPRHGQGHRAHRSRSRRAHAGALQALRVRTERAQHQGQPTMHNQHQNVYSQSAAMAQTTPAQAYRHARVDGSMSMPNQPVFSPYHGGYNTNLSNSMHQGFVAPTPGVRAGQPPPPRGTLHARPWRTRAARDGDAERTCMAARPLTLSGREARTRDLSQEGARSAPLATGSLEFPTHL
jgi:hypothetical protein